MKKTTRLLAAEAYAESIKILESMQSLWKQMEGNLTTPLFDIMLAQENHVETIFEILKQE